MLKELREKIKEKGGFVNAHAHLDRANTARFFSKEEQYKFLEEKWKLVDRIKKDSNYWAYYSRIDHAVTDQIGKGVSTICSFVDVDDVATNKAYIASKEVAEHRKHDVTLVTAMQTLKGVLDPKLQTIMHNAASSVNIIGSLPGGDKGSEDDHIDWIMNAAKRYKKRVHARSRR
jgi:cytosine deaminase